MTDRVVRTLGTCLLCVSLGSVALGASEFGVGMRRHVEHSVFVDRPLGDGDLSYGLAYEYHEDSGFWQLALDYTPDPTRVDTVDYVLTPQMNLLFKDKLWRGGLGALSSYVSDKVDGDEWTALYWQFVLGLGIPLLDGRIDAYSYYVFEEWGDIGEMSTDDLEFGLWFTVGF